jgi:hypothetical protein
MHFNPNFMGAIYDVNNNHIMLYKRRYWSGLWGWLPRWWSEIIWISINVSDNLSWSLNVTILIIHL